jgi:hypothetical protein
MSKEGLQWTEGLQGSNTCRKDVTEGCYNAQAGAPEGQQINTGSNVGLPTRALVRCPW